MEAPAWIEPGIIVFLVAIFLAIICLYVMGRLLFSAIASKDHNQNRPLFMPKSQIDAKKKSSGTNHNPVSNGKAPVKKLSAGMIMDDENAPCFIHGVPKSVCKKKH